MNEGSKKSSDENNKLEELKKILFDTLKQIRKKLGIINGHIISAQFDVSTQGAILSNLLLHIKDVCLSSPSISFLLFIFLN